MRPKMIQYFEIIMFIALGLRTIKLIVEWDGTTRITGAGLASFALALNLGLTLLLTLLVSRRRSKTAMWMLIALFALSLPILLVGGFKAVFTITGLIGITQLLAQLIAYRLLFTPSAKLWLNRVSENIGTVPECIVNNAPGEGQQSV